LNKKQEAQKIENALKKTLMRGIMTPDLGGTASTMEMAEAIREELIKQD
ncbi:NAD-dependent isocitrate dehydrogenase, partial [Methanothermobacter thermautotrophicus]